MNAPDDFALVFDWDGVIINSESFHRRSWEMLMEEASLKMPPGAFEASFGMRNEQIIPHVFKWASPDDGERIQALGDRKEALYRKIVRDEGIAPLPGVLDLLESLTAHGVPAAVGSSTPRANIDAVMEVIGVTGMFQEVVAAGDVRQGKPHPEVFLTAASRLGFAPARCVVVEDAHVGIEAAKAGGFAVLAVATTHPMDSLRDADAVHESLADVTVEALRGLLD